MDIIWIAIAVLGGTGVIAAGVLYLVARKFYTYEDPRIADVEAMLPGANCGACGYNGCHDFAVNCVKAGTLQGFNCPGAGADGMKRIADYLGLSVAEAKPMVAVLRCYGTCEKRPRRAVYDGARSCALLGMLAAGEGSCPYGCLGCGDCVAACPWGAMSLDAETGLPVIDESRCIGCGVCVAACPRRILELRARGPRGMRVWVACANKERGPVAMKECKAACIGCAKCQKVCTHEAITVADNLAYIDFEKCRLCRKCVDACPTGAIHDVNFPVKKTTTNPSDTEKK